MKFLLLAIVIPAWIYSLYAIKKAQPSNGCAIGWCIATMWWGFLALACIFA